MPEVIEEAPLRKAIGTNVQRLREERGLSQKALAEQVGISRVNLNRIECGHATPGADVIFSLADVLGVAADTLRQVS